MVSELPEELQSQVSKSKSIRSEVNETRKADVKQKMEAQTMRTQLNPYQKARNSKKGNK